MKSRLEDRITLNTYTIFTENGISAGGFGVIKAFSCLIWGKKDFAGRHVGHFFFRFVTGEKVGYK